MATKPTTTTSVDAPPPDTPPEKPASGSGYRATRTEGRVAVGNWTGDLNKGQVFSVGDPKTTPDAIPQEVADYLVGHGVLVEADSEEDNQWFDSEDPDLSGKEPEEVTPPPDSPEGTEKTTPGEGAPAEPASP